MSATLPLPVAGLLLAAALSSLVRSRRWPPRAITAASLTLLLVHGIAAGAQTAAGQVLATAVGGFPARFAIVLVADLLTALLLVATAVVGIACVGFAAATGGDHHPFFHPLVLVLLAGICGAFLTADLFTLFVFFEVALVASYALLTLRGTHGEIRVGPVYITVNLLGSLTFLAGVGLLYAATGTVGMAELASRPDTATVAAVPGVLFLVAFAVKAALIPLGGWLPRSYAATAPAVAALFSGLMSAVGIYAIYRVYTVVYGARPDLSLVLLVAGGVTMLVGALAALGAEPVRQVLAFQVVGQVGLPVVGLGLFGVVGVAAGIFYLLQDIVVKTALFLTAGAVEAGAPTVVGRSGRGILAAAFGLGALSLTGIPPLPGFVGKLALVRAALGGPAGLAVAGVIVVVSALVLVSMTQIGSAAFWADDAPARGEPESGALPGIPALVLSLGALGLGIFGEELLRLSRRAAEGLIDPSAYLRAVLG